MHVSALFNFHLPPMFSVLIDIYNRDKNLCISHLYQKYC
jgi:hypothetical protein